LASNTKKREGKAMSSLGVLFFNLIIVVIFFFFFVIFASGVAVPHPRVFHGWRRKRGIDDGLRGLKTHRRVHLALALFKRGKSLTHLSV
jgi:uncharacterized membrane protein